MATKIVSGMDLDKLEAFRTSLEESPVILGLGAQGVWEGHSGRSTVHIGPYDLNGQRIDTQDAALHRFLMERGKRSRRRSDLWVQPTAQSQSRWRSAPWLPASVNSIALNAPRHGIKLEGLEITVHADVDPSVLFEVKGPESHTSCMPKITTEVKVKGDITG